MVNASQVVVLGFESINTTKRAKRNAGILESASQLM